MKHGRGRDTGSGIAALALLGLAVFVAASISGCANFTKEERLADKCYHSGGKASISYAGDTGRVDCR